MEPEFNPLEQIQTLQAQSHLQMIQSIPLRLSGEYYQLPLHVIQKSLENLNPDPQLGDQPYLYHIRPFASNAMSYAFTAWKDKNHKTLRHHSLKVILQEGLSDRAVLLSKAQLEWMGLHHQLLNWSQYRIIESVHSFVRRKNQKFCFIDVRGMCWWCWGCV